MIGKLNALIVASNQAPPPPPPSHKSLISVLTLRKGESLVKLRLEATVHVTIQ